MKYVIYICSSKTRSRQKVFKVGQTLLNSDPLACAEKRINSINTMSFEDISLNTHFISPASDYYIHHHLCLLGYERVKGEWFKVDSYENLCKNIENIINNFIPKNSTQIQITLNELFQRSLTIKNRRVFLDSDVAMYFATSTKVLNKCAKRNNNSFIDFSFKLNKDQYLYILKEKQESYSGGHLPWVYTEEAIMQFLKVLRTSSATQDFNLLIKSLKNLKQFPTL